MIAANAAPRFAYAVGPLGRVDSTSIGNPEVATSHDPTTKAGSPVAETTLLPLSSEANPRKLRAEVHGDAKVIAETVMMTSEATIARVIRVRLNINNGPFGSADAGNS